MPVPHSIDLGSNFLSATSAEVVAAEGGPLVTIWYREGEGPRTMVKLDADQFRALSSVFRMAKKESDDHGKA